MNVANSVVLFDFFHSSHPLCLHFELKFW